MPYVQLLRFTKSTGKGTIWINPEQVIYAEPVESKDNKGPMTVVHVTGKEGKVFIKESPEEMNKIFRSIRKQIKVEL